MPNTTAGGDGANAKAPGANMLWGGRFSGSYLNADTVLPLNSEELIVLIC